jgi:protein phosphatase
MTTHPGRATFATSRAGWLTDPGVVRAENQDSVYVADPATVDTTAKGVLVAVADGMGGAAGGALASSTAVEALAAYYSEPSNPGMADLAVSFRIEAAHAKLQALAKARPQLKGMGTTLTAGLLIDGVVQLFHVGDSRAYLLREGRLEPLTEDHTLLAKWKAQGTLLKNPRGLGKSVLTRAVGVTSEITIDRVTVQTATGDRLLFCSDGLHGVVEPAALQALLEESKAPWEAARRLVDAARSAGGPDNVTAVVLDVGPPA